MALKSAEINTYFGRCRCCLNYGYLKNMWEEHDWQGEKEVYVEMLVQCFALSWEHSEDSMEHDQICDSCVLRLRDAYSFKKSILESQDKLLGLNNEDMEVHVKIEKPDCSSQEGSDNEAAATSIYIDEPDDPDDPADPDYVEPEYLEDPDDPHDPDDPDDPEDPDDPDVSNEMEYEEVEYLDIEDNKEALAFQQNPQTVNTSARRMKSKKPPEIPPKGKWARKLPKSERYKTYKQYTEEDLRKCLEAVRNAELTAREAAVKFNIPKKTIVAKTKVLKDSNDGQSETTKTTPRERTNSRKTAKRKIILKFKDNVRHILENSNATPLKGHWGIGYGCYYCQYQNASAAELKMHTLRSHSDVIDAIKAECYGSINIKLDITGLQCSICDGKFEFLNEFIEHLNVIHFKEMYLDTTNYIIPYKFDTEYLQCAICSRQFPYFKHLTEHMTEHYRNVFCDVCGRGFINKMSLKTHIMRHNTGIFTCSYCSKVFDARVKMMSHERIVHIKESRTRKCGYCDERFKDHKEKTLHEASVHGVKMPSFECKACGKKYNSQRGLRCHTKSYHLMVKRHVCDVCGKGFCYRNGLKMHMITHTGAREFQCGVCLKWYSTKKVLRAHMRIHENDRRFKCVICERAFVQKCAWMQHMRNKHAGEFDGV